MTYSSPSRIAVVRMPATSEPAPGSVIPRLPIFSPFRPGSRYSPSAPRCRAGGSGQDHVGLDREAHVGAAGAGVAHALGADQRVEVVAALAAVLLREAEAEEAELAGPLHRRGRPVGVLPLVAVGPQLLFTHDSIDSRRSSCSWLKMKCLRPAAWSGLMTLEPLVAVATGLSPRSRVGRRQRPPKRVDSSTSHFHTIGYGPGRDEQARATSRSQVAYEVADGVATVTLNNPEKRNMLSGQMLAELVDAMKPARSRRGGPRRRPHRGRRQGLLRRRRPRRLRGRRAAGRQTLRLRPLPRVLPADAAARQALALRRQRPRAGGGHGPRPLLRPGDRQRGRHLRHAGDQRRRLPLHDHVDHLPQRPAQEGQRDDAAGRAAERRAGGRVRARQQGRRRRTSSTPRSPSGRPSSPRRARC